MATTARPKPTLLLVEEESEALALLTETLAPHFHLRTATDTPNAHTAAVRYKPDAIIASIDIPGSRDLELIRWVRENPALAATPVIVLSSAASEARRIQSYQALADLFLAKPFNPEELLSSVSALLRIRKLIGQSVPLGSTIAREQVISEEDLCLLDRLDSTIRSRLDDPALNVGILARACFISVRQLERKLPELLEITPRQYLRKFRMEQARTWLERGRYTSVAQVSQAVGYQNERSFQRAFHTVFSQNPSQLIRS